MTFESGLLGNRALANGLWAVIRKTGLAPLALRWHPRSALRQLGWYSSFRASRPIDGSGGILPWWTYPSIEFLEPRLSAGLRVVEFGAGHSTLWLSARVGEVVSFESDPAWANRMRPALPGNARIIAVDSYEQVIESPPVDLGRFDLAVIDCSGERVRCAEFAITHLLRSEGVLLWDNTEGPMWEKIVKLTAPHGFREISFSGMAPQVLHWSTTTVFYRPGQNSLEI